LNYLNQLTSRAQSPAPTPVVENYVRKKIVLPKYPRVAEQRGIQGEVVVEFSIDESGNVLNPEIVSNNASDIFNNNVLRAIKQFSFEPQKVNGMPVAVQNVREVFVFVIEA
jgi:protein TonB